MLCNEALLKVKPPTPPSELEKKTPKTNFHSFLLPFSQNLPQNASPLSQPGLALDVAVSCGPMKRELKHNRHRPKQRIKPNTTER